MLPEIQLDQQSFEEIIEDAKKQIAKVYPQWTNYNEADPGITFLELFAWLKEMQQYHLDQIGERNKRKYLKLLGAWPEPMFPAKALLSISGLKEDCLLLDREQFFADQIPFETIGRQQLVKAKPVLLRCLLRDRQMELGLSQLEPGGKIQLYPFGNEPHIGNCFQIGFDNPLPVHHSFEIYLQVYDDYPVKRCPIGKEEPFQPLAKLRWEYYTSSGWREACLVRDESYQFLQNGFLEFRLEEPMAEGADGLYWMRAVLEQNWYEVPPILTGMYLNILRTAQWNTIADCDDFSVNPESRSIQFHHRLSGSASFLQKEQNGYRPIEPSQVQMMQNEDGSWLAKLPADGEIRVLYQNTRYAGYLLPAVGNGFPNQRYQLDLEHVMGSKLQLMVEEPDGLWHCWEQVKDFDCSLPESRHYCFDEQTGFLSFGDCEHGMAPVGTLHLVRLLISEGVNGNVKQHQIRESTALPPGATVTNYWMASGGKQGETLEQSFLRARASLRKLKRAVTNEDYERQVKEAPGLMIQNCRCVPVTKLYREDSGWDENSVAIVVQPFSNGKREKLNEGYYRNLYGFLDRRRLMGTRVKILSPEYIGLTVYAEIRIRPYYQNAPRIIQNTVEKFFDTSNWVFGEPVQYSTLYGVIDRLECVLSVDSLTIDARGSGVSRNRSGDVLIPPNGLVYLVGGEYNLSDEE